ncbi:MAG: glycosyltransferase [Candidatus Aenigmatarchaeota archaeon]
MNIKKNLEKNIDNNVKEKTKIQSKKLNILLLSIPFSIPAGAAIVPERLFHGLIRMNMNIVVLTHWWNCTFEDVIRYNVITKDNYKTFVEGEINGNRIAKVKEFRIIKTKYGNRWIPKSIEKLVPEDKIIEAGKICCKKAIDYILSTGFKPDVIHIHTHTFTYDKTLPIILEKTNYPPTLYTLHALIRTITKEREKAQEETIKLSDKLVTISDGWKKSIEENYHRDCFVIHNATDYFPYLYDDYVKSRAEELRNVLAPNGEKLILFSGRPEKIKMQGLPLAFNEIVDKWNAKLIIVGSSGEKGTISNLQNWGIKPKYLERIHFTGWINGITEEGRREIAAYYKMLTHFEGDKFKVDGVLVMPARTKDHYGLSVLDAMALKAPVITCPGRLATYGCDPDALNLVKGINFVLSNPREVLTRIEKTYDIVKNEYGIDNYFVPEHIKLYSELINKKREEKLKIFKEALKESEKNEKVYETELKKLMLEVLEEIRKEYEEKSTNLARITRIALKEIGD